MSRRLFFALFVLAKAFLVKSRMVDLSFLTEDLMTAVDMKRPAIFCNPKQSVNKTYMRGIFLEAKSTVFLGSRQSRDLDLEMPLDLVVCVDQIEISHFWSQYTNSSKFRRSKIRPMLLVFETLEYSDLFSDPKFQLDIDRRVYFYNLSAETLFEQYDLADGARRVRTSLGGIESGSNALKLHAIAEKPFLARRSDFQGLDMKVVVENQSPYAMFDKKYKVPVQRTESTVYELENFTSVSGLFIDIMENLARDMNFSIHNFRRYDESWGTFVNESYSTGMVDSIVKGHVDIIGTTFTITPERNQALYFLVPMAKETYAVYILNPEQQGLSWDIFRRPFRNQLWLVLIMAAFGLAIAIKVVDSVYGYVIIAGQKKKQCNLSPLARHFQTLQEVLSNAWVVFKSYFGGRPSEVPSSSRWAARFLLLSILLTGTVVFIAYRGAITSELAARLTIYPFNTLEGLLNSDYRLITISGGMKADFFLKANKGIFMQLHEKLMRKFGEEAFVESNREGIDALLADSQVAFFSTREAFNPRCDVVPSWTTETPDQLAMALKKDSPLAPFINYHVLRMFQNGLVPLITTRWRKPPEECGRDNVSGLGFEKVFTVFLFLTGAFVAALILCCLELIFYTGFHWNKVDSPSWEDLLVERLRSIFPLLRSQHSSPEEVLDQLEELVTTIREIRQKSADFKHDSIRLK